MPEPLHLGDGAYVRLTEYGEVVIYAHNGIHPTNSVYLERIAVQNLVDWLKRNIL